MTGLPPDDLPRSPTGRVPKWVVDQAAGRPIEATPFRAPVGPSLLEPRPVTRRGRGLRIIATVLLVAFVGGGVWWGVTQAGVGPGPGPASADAASVPPAFDRPPAGLEETPRPAGLPQGAARETPTSGFRYLAHQSDRVTPVTWSPCRPIHYVVRAANQPAGGSAILAAAFAAASKATGIRFILDGATDQGPVEDPPAYQPDVYGQRWAPVVVDWATTQEVPDFGVDVAGEAGPLGTYTDTGETVWVSGRVSLDAAYFRGLVGTEKGRRQAQAIVMHELGHLMGLAHVNDKRQLMFPQAGSTMAYGPGDLAGLQSLGRGPCRPEV